MVVGRITHDNESSSLGKLTEATLTLESSRSLGSGSRVPLRFDAALKIRGGAKGAGSLGLFPGAIVALKGKNGGGGSFVVSEILAVRQGPERPTFLLTRDYQLPSLPESKAKHEVDASGFTMCIARGPYTQDVDLKYRPWRSTLQGIKNHKPDVVLLVGGITRLCSSECISCPVQIGPFLDPAHPKLKAGDADTTPTQLFRAMFIEPLVQYLDSVPGSMAILMPDVRDLVSAYAVYPQAELSASLVRDSVCFPLSFSHTRGLTSRAANTACAQSVPILSQRNWLRGVKCRHALSYPEGGAHETWGGNRLGHSCVAGGYWDRFDGQCLQAYSATTKVGSSIFHFSFFV